MYRVNKGDRKKDEMSRDEIRKAMLSDKIVLLVDVWSYVKI